MSAKDKIIAFLSTHTTKAHTASEVARKARVSITTARRVLVQLEDENKVCRDLDIGLNGSGVNIYSWLAEEATR